VTASIVVVPEEVVRVTRLHLRAQGQTREEGVVLWVGTLDPPTVTSAIVPEQVTGFDRFHVPLSERQRIARDLAGTGQIVVAQVHSHPHEAFHSNIDDLEAVPRHVGAYSLVVADFGAHPNLLERARLFRRDAAGKWEPAPLSTFDVPTTFTDARIPTTSTSPGGLRWRRLIDTLKSFGRSPT
jgi:hypothetical protein